MNWPLNVDNFTFLDRLKICKFILNQKNKWTQSVLVNEFERKMADFVGSKYAIFCSSGSTANTMIAMQLKDASNKNVVVFPSTTWTTSVTPFIREGFTPKFIDVNLEDFSFDYASLEKFLEVESASVAAIFATSLLGFVPNISKLIELSHKYNVKLMFDNCENTFGKFEEKNVSSFATSTTSTYFGHHLQSVEGGFVFTNDQLEYEYFLMLRNHGMTRSVADNEKYLNKDVDSRFDFYCLGNNFRNCEIRSLIGMLDLERADLHTAKRKYLYNLFASEIDTSKFILAETFENRDPVPFAFPIICKEFNTKKIGLDYCAANSIETRPIISGNLLRQTCFKKYEVPEEFPNSELLHHNGFYVGLHTKLKDNQVLDLTDYLNGF